jgi:hypothetical protein
VYNKRNVKEGYLRTAGNPRLIQAYGDLDINVTLDNGKNKQITLYEVAYVPGCPCNLLCMKDMAVRFGGVMLEEDGLRQTIGKGREYQITAWSGKKIKLQLLKVKRIVKELEMANVAEDINVLHHRYGHIGEHDIKVTAARYGLTVKGTLQDCPDCDLHKLKRKPVNKTPSNRTQDVFQCDLSGPRVAGHQCGNLRYTMWWVHAATRMAWVKGLKNKTESAKGLKWFDTTVGRQRENKPIIQVDGGKEFVNKDYRVQLENLQYGERLTAPYSPWQNGIVERRISEVSRMAATLLSAAGMPEQFWYDAYLHANDAKNIAPTRGNEAEIPPLIAYHGKGTTMPEMHTFGALAYVKEEGLLKKGDARSAICAYLGRARPYPEGTARFLNLSTMRRRVSQNYKVYDNVVATATFYGDASRNFVDLQGSKEQKAAVVMEGFNRPMHSVDFAFGMRTAMDRHCYIALTNDSPTLKEALAGPERELWVQAMNKEIQLMLDNKVYRPCRKVSGRKALQVGWVLRKKRDASGRIAKFKARMVAKGYTQVEGVDFDMSYASVASSSTLRLFIAIATQEGLIIFQTDFDTAFLNANIDHDIYIIVPKEFKLLGIEIDEECEWLKLEKALYGLIQSPRLWFYHLVTYLEEKLGFTQNEAEPCILHKTTPDGSKLIVLIYVDDLLIAGTSEEVVDELLTEIEKDFNIKRLGRVNTFLSCQIEQDMESGITYLHQEPYILSLLVKYENYLTSKRLFETPGAPGSNLQPSTEDEKGSISSEIKLFPYREMVGGLMYLSTWSRPDISFAVRELAKQFMQWNKNHCKAAIRVLYYLRDSKDLRLRFQRSSVNYDDIHMLSAYSDADWATDEETRRSVSGGLVLAGETPVQWMSRGQSIVATSSCEAEYIALGETAKELTYLRMVMQQLCPISSSIPSIVRVDNEGAIKLANNNSGAGRTKHMELRRHYVRELIERKVIKLKFVGTKEQISDIFTKNLPVDQFKKLRAKLLVGDSRTAADFEEEAIASGEDASCVVSEM